METEIVEEEIKAINIMPLKDLRLKYKNEWHKVYKITHAKLNESIFERTNSKGHAYLAKHNIGKPVITFELPNNLKFTVRHNEMLTIKRNKMAYEKVGEKKCQ